MPACDINEANSDVAERAEDDNNLIDDDLIAIPIYLGDEDTKATSKS